MTFPDWRGQPSQSGSVHTALAVEVLLTGNEIFSFVVVQLQFSKTTTKRRVKSKFDVFRRGGGRRVSSPWWTRKQDRGGPFDQGARFS